MPKKHIHKRVKDIEDTIEHVIAIVKKIQGAVVIIVSTLLAIGASIVAFHQQIVEMIKKIVGG